MKEVVWSVNIFIGAGIVAVALLIFLILRLAHQE
jgi:hypothetical protein